MLTIFTRNFQSPILWSWRTPYLLPLRGFHPVSRSVPRDFTKTFRRWESVRTPHCPWGLRFGLGRFHSQLLTTSHSVSFPVDTKMFQFSTFPIAQGNCEGIPIRRSWVLRLRAAPSGLSQLGTSFFGARAEPSTSWHSSHAVGIALWPGKSDPVDAWIALTHGRHRHVPVVVGSVHRTLPTRAFTEWCIGLPDQNVSSRPT